MRREAECFGALAFCEDILSASGRGGYVGRLEQVDDKGTGACVIAGSGPEFLLRLLVLGPLLWLRVLLLRVLLGRGVRCRRGPRRFGALRLRMRLRSRARGLGPLRLGMGLRSGRLVCRRLRTIGGVLHRGRTFRSAILRFGVAGSSLAWTYGLSWAYLLSRTCLFRGTLRDRFRTAGLRMLVHRLRSLATSDHWRRLNVIRLQRVAGNHDCGMTMTHGSKVALL